MRYELQRLRRVWWPNRYDHSAYMLIEILGRNWLFFTGWKREYRVGKLMIDIAHPRLKLALEADGERWHRDIVREFDRDSALERLGWDVLHFRYPELKDHPSRVKRKVRRWFWRHLLFTIRRK